MPVFGWLAGRAIVDQVATYDHWVAFALLAAIGSRMIWGSLHSKHDHSDATDITKAFPLLALSVATSIDALAVGLTFAFLEVNLALASSTIGVVAFIVTIIGFLVGKKVGELFGKRAEAIGGIVLIGIGLRILLTHML
jgi:putative Mn2+ efflux pump MntP